MIRRRTSKRTRDVGRVGAGGPSLQFAVTREAPFQEPMTADGVGSWNARSGVPGAFAVRARLRWHHQSARWLRVETDGTFDVIELVDGPAIRDWQTYHCRTSPLGKDGTVVASTLLQLGCTAG